MKNKYYEYLKKKRFQNRKKRSRQYNENGLKVYHIYDEEKKLAPYSWWDDVGFKMGKNHYVVFFIHPRMKYLNECEDLAHKKVGNCGDIVSLLKDNIKIHAKVGKSRKKIKFYQLRAQSEEEKNWYEKFKKEQSEILVNKDNHIKIKPTFKVVPLSYAKSIEICYPIEIRSENDLLILVNFVKDVLTRKKDFSELSKNYCYDVNNWINEGHKNA